MKKYSFFYGIVLVLVGLNLQAQKVNLNEGLISLYEFDGNTNDISGNGNHGVLYGPVLSADRFGNPNKAYFFDGVDDYIEIDPVSDVSNIGDFTIAVWANCVEWEIQSGIVNGVFDSQYIFDGQSYSKTVTSDFYRDGFIINYRLNRDYSEAVMNSIRDIDASNFINEISISRDIENVWHHIVFIRNGTQTNHYIDGVLVDTDTNTGFELNMHHKWNIGTFSGNNPYYNRLNYNFYGLIDDIYIYKRAINACEVEALYSGEFPPER